MQLKIGVLAVLTIMAVSSCRKSRVNNKGCESAYIYEKIDTCTVLIPNFMSPNGDGRNDRLFPVCDCPIQLTDIKVFKLSGKEVYRETSLSLGWDGKVDHEYKKDNVYDFSMEVVVSGQTRSYKGQVTKVGGLESNSITNIDNCIGTDRYDTPAIDPNSYDVVLSGN